MSNDSLIGIKMIWNLMIALVIIGAFVIGYGAYEVGTTNGRIKSQTKPVIDYELKANGKEIDTVWIVKSITH